MGTVLITVVSGVFVFVISQYFMEIYLRPLQEYRKLRCKVSYVLTRDAQHYMNPITYGAAEKFQEKYDKVSAGLRDLAAELRGFIETVPPKFSPGIPPKEDIYTASSEMIGLSNSLWVPKGSETKDAQRQIDDNEDRRRIICQKLKIFRNE